MFGRLRSLVRSFFGLFIFSEEKKNPQALLASIEENMRKDIAQFNQGLISQASLLEQLKTQVNKQESECTNLTNRTKASVQAGKMDAAKETAYQLKKLTDDLSSNREQFEAANKTYERLRKMRDQVIAKAKERINKIKNDLSEAERNKALSSLTEMANGMSFETNSHADQLKRLDEIASTAREQSAARLKVAQDSSALDKVDEIEKQENALKDEALANFLAQGGVSLPSVSEQPQIKTIG